MNTRKYRNADTGVGVIIAIWILGVILNVAFWGVVVWAIIKITQAVTA
jgi:hypothetical protein